MKRFVENSRGRSNATAIFEAGVHNTSWTNVIKRLRMWILHIHEYAH